MSTPLLQQNEVGPGQHGTNDSSFDSFIDSNLILDASSPAPITPKKAANRETSMKSEVAAKGKERGISNLSALPPRLHETGSLSVSDFISYPHHVSSPTVTTPTTSNSSSLHNLNFDFFDPHGSDHSGSADNSTSFASESSEGKIRTPVTTFGDSPSQTLSPNSISASNHIFSWNAAPSSFYPIPLVHSFSRSVDDLGQVMSGQHSSSVTASHHHQRSLSLREVAPPSASDDMVLADSLTTLPFPSVKLEHESTPQYAGTFADNAPSPITEDHSSPTSTAVSSNLCEQASPRQEKKRRLDSPSESTTSNQSSKDTKGASMARSNTGNAKKGTGGTSKKRSRASTLTDKNNTIVSPPSVIGLGFNPASLIENVAAASSAPTQVVSKPSQLEGQKEMQGQAIVSNVDTSMEEQDDSIIITATRSERDGSAAPKLGNKRPPPSASQVTESGQPFPVIDTSAKHSSLFVPPDTSGLTKREARLVKNRAAAFLSRQRKREQFEELEVKCKSLCRLVWRFWEIVAGPQHDISFTEKYSQTKILPIVLEEEADEVKEVLEMVVALKGGSVAPTEDGQLQGAMSAGISSANGKIIGTSTTNQSAANTGPLPPAPATSQGVQTEIARLKAELQESKNRESALQAELVQERSMRMNDNYTQGIRKPFKGNKQEEALSLTISPDYQARNVAEEEEEDEGQGLADDISSNTIKGKLASRSNIRTASSRTSERLQRQQSHLALTSVTGAANGGQRKAAGAALMMVLFSFALFGLPNGQVPRAGGITRIGNAEDLSAGKVLGAPLSGAQYTKDEEDDIINYDLTSSKAPSSHLSVKDLLPPMPDMSDLLNLEDDDNDEATTYRPDRMNRSFREVLSGSQGDDEDNIVDYKAFAKDLGASLDWDVQRGFIVIGSDHDRIETEDAKMRDSDENQDKTTSNKGESDAPTKLTLFVPAPDVTGDLESEDRFYDAPLASVDVTTGRDEAAGLIRDLTQAEATRAALRVLRNHRIAQEAAALATSRRLGKEPSPSQRVRSPHQFNAMSQSSQENGKASNQKDHTNLKTHLEGEEEEDFSNEVMDETSTTDKIRGTDFYQLEFSLSGAKVRNVAELAKLLGVARNKK